MASGVDVEQIKKVVLEGHRSVLSIEYDKSLAVQ